MLDAIEESMEEARTQANRRVTLVDLERLFELWIEYYEDLDDEARRPDLGRLRAVVAVGVGHLEVDVRDRDLVEVEAVAVKSAP